MTKKKDEFTKEESTKEVTESSISTNSVKLWIQQFEKKSSTTKKNITWSQKTFQIQQKTKQIINRECRVRKKTITKYLKTLRLRASAYASNSKNVLEPIKTQDAGENKTISAGLFHENIQKNPLPNIVKDQKIDERSSEQVYPSNSYGIFQNQEKFLRQ